MKSGTILPIHSFVNVMKHVDHMRTHFLNRKSGQGIDLKAGQYVVEVLNSYGLDAGLQEFETYDSDIGTSFVALYNENGDVIKSLPCLHIEPTPEEGITADLVDVGPGGLEDYADKDVRGKIVLAEVSYAPATPEKARIAASKGAIGIVLMNWGEDDSTYIPWRALKAVWGNPTPESWHDIPRLFGVSISRADGIALRKKMQIDTVSLYVRATATRVWRNLSQPLGWLHAPSSSPERDQFVIVSGHIDSWNPGVTDNITGMAVMMEVARFLAEKRESLRRSVVFCFWNGHEVAEAAGSTYFVDSHWEQINRNAVAYFNIDSVGMKGTTEFHINSCPELAAFSVKLSEAVYADKLPQKITNLRRVGDQSFFGVGVSAVTGRHSYGADVVKAQNGATLGWYNHTEFDTIEVMDPDALAEDLDWCARYVNELVTLPVLPQRFLPRAMDMMERFKLATSHENSPKDLTIILECLDKLTRNVSWFDNYLNGISQSDSLCQYANRLILRLSRLLTFPTASASGRYGQDSYGISTLSQPVPLLACLKDYCECDPDSLEAKLLRTKIMRLRHEITDVLQMASDQLDDFRFTVECIKNPDL